MHDAHRHQQGQSLAELMVVTLVLTIIVAAITGAFISAQKTADEADNRLENLQEAQRLVSAASRDVRTATPLAAGQSPFLSAEKRRMLFYGQLNFTSGSTQTLPNKVEITVDTTNPAAPVLKELVWVPVNPTAASPTYTTTPTTTRFVGQYVQNQVNDPIFRYYDADGNELTSVPLNASDQLKVRTVGIALSIRKQTNRVVQPTRVETTVRLTNVIYGNLTSS